MKDLVGGFSLIFITVVLMLNIIKYVIEKDNYLICYKENNKEQCAEFTDRKMGQDFTAVLQTMPEIKNIEVK